MDSSIGNAHVIGPGMSVRDDLPKAEDADSLCKIADVKSTTPEADTHKQQTPETNSALLPTVRSASALRTFPVSVDIYQSTRCAEEMRPRERRGW